MSDIAVRVENLGKMYCIGRAQQRHDTLRDAIAAGLGSLRPGSTSHEETIWALKDVSFEVRRGEVLGVIGRNGAGKSTLLKILSRITEPTTGRAEIHGRVGSLLEVGTGFHPELTGRENIYLNGAILGMRRTEIARGFDEIVAFAEIDKFLDTPVKHYSSGMYVRLAFAVAAHLDPEILLVDEVLAVGDARFQERCLGKMGQVAQAGRTVLFVSHNLASIQTLCPRVILLQGGCASDDGGADQVIANYLGQMHSKSLQPLAVRGDRGGSGEARIVSASVASRDSGQAALRTGCPVSFRFEADRSRPGMSIQFTIYNAYGRAVANFNSALRGSEDITLELVTSHFECHLDELNLAPGSYRVNVALLADRIMLDHVEAALMFEVSPGVVRGRPINSPLGGGDAILPHRWEVPR